MRTSRLHRSLRGWWLASSLLVAALFFPHAAQAQVLCPATTYTDNALYAELTGGLDVRQGNASSVWTHEALCGRFELADHWASLRLTHAFGKARVDPGVEGRFVQAVRLLPQYRYRFLRLGESGGLRGEVLLQYEHDEQRRIAQRVQPGLGSNLSFVDTDVLRLSFTLAYLFGYEQLDDALPSGLVASDAGERSIDQRAWASLELGWNPHANVFLGAEVSAQVPLDHSPVDTRLYAQTTLRVKGTEWLALEIACLVMFDPEPAEGVEDLDFILRSGLVFTL